MSNNNKKYTISIITLGCRVNQYESASFIERLRSLGIEIVEPGEKCDAAIVNTCTVTAESDRKSRQMIRRAGTYADRVIVTGCYAQIEADKTSSIDGVVYVCGNNGKADLADTVYKILTDSYSGKINSVEAIDTPNSRRAVEMITSIPERARSFIKIEDGCENKCAYCIIPKARGPVRSKLPETVITEARALVAAGCREVILTGIETASYGMDFIDRAPYGNRLGDLIREVNKIDGLMRIGLGSLEPTIMTDYFTTAIAESEKALPHFHLSIQSGCSKTLAAMRRRYNADMAAKAIQRMREKIPDATFSADIIVGFPGETDADFNETIEFCRNADFLHIHIFPYSKRAGTEAAAMNNQVPENIKHLRAAQLGAVGNELKRGILDRYIADHVTVPAKLLVEKCVNNVCFGHSEHFIEMRVEKFNAEAGDILDVIPEKHDGNICYCRVAAKQASNNK